MSDIPAGWQPDPRGRHEYRYWDGSQWTDHVSNQGTVSSDPVADTSPAAGDSEKSAIFKPDPTPESTGSSEPAHGAEATEVQPTADVGHGATPMPTESTGAPAASQPLETEPTQRTEPVVSEPTPAATTPAAAASVPPTASSAPPGAGPPASSSPRTESTEGTAPATAQTDAKAAAQEVLHSKSPELGTILSAVVPGSGHFYMGTNKVPLAAGLLIATIAAVVISHISFVMFLIGFVVWAAAAAFALTDLRGGVRGIENTSLPKNVIGILMIAAGALLVISLFLPYYRVSAEIDVPGFSQSQTVSGNAFEVFSLEDIILLIIGIAAIIAGAASLGLGPVTSAELPRWLPTAVAIGGAIATVIILFRMFVDSAPGFGPLPGGVDISIGRAFGIWIGLWSAMILLIANASTLRSLSKK